MRKIAREAVIFCLLGAAIGSVYLIARQYQSFREQGASEARRVAACKQAPTLPPTESDTPSFDFCNATELYTRPQPSKAERFFQQSLGGAVLGFFLGFALWGGYRLVRFAIRG
jgi:hypothetical protein